MTSISLEDTFWHELGRIPGERRVSVAHLVSSFDSERKGGLSSAIRFFVLNVVKSESGGKSDRCSA